MANVIRDLGSPTSSILGIIADYVDISLDWAVVGAPGRVEAIVLTLYRKFLIEDFSSCSNNDLGIEDKAGPRSEARRVDAPYLRSRISDVLQGTLLELMIPLTNWQR